MDDRDELLVAAARRGEEVAWEELVARHHLRVHRIVARIVRNPADAEDVTQEVFLTLVRKLATFKGESAFSSWLYRIAVNAAFMRLRGGRRRGEGRVVSLDEALPQFDGTGHFERAVADLTPAIDELMVAAELRAHVEKLVAELPEGYRSVLVLRDMEGLSNEETASVLDLTVAAVKSRLHRARAWVREGVATFLSSSGAPLAAALHPTEKR